MIQLTCPTCNTEKPKDQFYWRKDNRKPRSECKQCTIDLHRFRIYGVTRSQYFTMLENQNSACAICGTTQNGKGSRYKMFAVDHCHSSGKVRGLLCTNCNTALGLLNDSVEALDKARAYLLRN